MVPVIDLHEVADITGLLDEVRPARKGIRPARESWTEPRVKVQRIGVLACAAHFVEGSHFPANCPGIVKPQSADKFILSHSGLTDSSEDLKKFVAGDAEFPPPEEMTQYFFRGIKKQSAEEKYGRLGKIPLRRMGEHLNRAEKQYIPADAVYGLATLVIMLLRRAPLKCAPKNSFTRYITNMGNTLRKMALRPACMRRVDKSFMFSQNATLLVHYNKVFPLIQFIIRRLVEESFSCWVRHKMPSMGAFGLWKTGSPTVKWLIGDLGFIPDDPISTVEFRRLIADEIDWLWTTYMMEYYTAFLENRVANGKGIPSWEYPVVDHKFLKQEVVDILPLPYFEWVSIPQFPNDSIPLAEDDDYRKIEEPVREIVRRIKTEESKELFPHCRPPQAIIESPEPVRTRLVRNWKESETIQMIGRTLRGDLEVHYLSSVILGSTLADPSADRICQVFFLQLEQMYGGGTPGSSEAIDNDNTLFASLSGLKESMTFQIQESAEQTLCRRHFLYKLMRHGNVLFNFPDVFKYYSDMIGWDAKAILESPRSQGPSPSLRLDQAAVNEFGYIPNTVQAALMGHQVLTGHPQEEGLIYFPGQNAWKPDRSSDPVVSPWRPHGKPRVPEMFPPKQSLTEFLLGDSAEEFRDEITLAGRW
ncbi:MAG: hypothetical protein DRQ56_10000 [Gammaproteobacteria bacterium]|nr:MAG: hypothetical protein DRQ56_10000 [Gammaproteobacteria bacterium]